MAKTCTNEKTAARQRWIENGLLELMQSRKFEDITVTELCIHLDLPRRSFYRYFSDMEDVLDSLMNHVFRDMAIADRRLTLESLEEDFIFWYHQRKLLNGLARSSMQSKLTQYALKYADEESMKRHLTADDLDMELGGEIYLFVLCGLSSLLIGWHAEGFQKTPAQMARIAHRLLSVPLLAKM